MPTKKTRSAIILGIFSLIILAFATYATVYEQIISQNNGFFNAIIFGVVLILVFIFITLIARIIGLRPDSDTSSLIKYFEYFALLAMFILFFVLKRGYTTSIPTSESIPFSAANYILNGNLHEGNEISLHLLEFPSNFMYAARLSILFKIFEASGKVYVSFNIFMMIFIAALVFVIVYLLSNKVCAFIATIIYLFMPGNAFLVYSYNTELLVTLFFTVSVFLYLLLILRSFRSKVPVIIISILCGYFAGAAICAEPTLILVYITLFITVILQKKETIIFTLASSLTAAAAVGYFTAYKALKMKVSFVDVLMGYLKSFNPVYNRRLLENSSLADCYKAFITRINDPSRFLTENFYFLTNESGSSYSDNQVVWLKLADQLVYIFLLLMCVILIIYLLRNAYNRVLPGLSILIAAFVSQLFGGVNDVNYFYFTTIIIILGSCTFYYMYLNHHPEFARVLEDPELAVKYKKAVQEEDEVTDTKAAGKRVRPYVAANGTVNTGNTASAAPRLSPEDMARARALVFIGEDEDLYMQIKEQERIERINNPIAATRIKSQISDSGEYESTVESIEFLDNLDEQKEVKQVHEVKAIPASRPVEVVKPVIAESYEYDETTEYDESIPEPEVPVIMPVESVEPEPTIPEAAAVEPDVTEYAAEPEHVVNEVAVVPDYKNNDDKELDDEFEMVDITSPSESETAYNAYNDMYTAKSDFNSEPDNFSQFDDIKEENLNNDLNIFELNDNIDDVVQEISKESPPEMGNMPDWHPDEPDSEPDEPVEEYETILVNGIEFKRRINPSRSGQDEPIDKKAAKRLNKLKAQQEKERLAKERKEAKAAKKTGKVKPAKADKNAAKPEKPVKNKAKKVKPGEPLDNPLPLPKPHQSKELDFDYDSNDNDDFDW